MRQPGGGPLLPQLITHSGVVEVIRLNGRGSKLEDYGRRWLPSRLLMIMPTGARTFIFPLPEGVVGRKSPDAAGVGLFPSSGSGSDEGVGVLVVFEETRRWRDQRRPSTRRLPRPGPEVSLVLILLLPLPLLAFASRDTLLLVELVG